MVACLGRNRHRRRRFQHESPLRRQIRSCRQSFPEGNIGGGPRECMGFVRYIHGTPPSHPQRVIGTYCEVGQTPISAARAGEVLGTLLVNPDFVE